MTLRLYPMTCGWLTAPLGLLLEGESGEIRIPVPCYLIDHPKGKVLFDSGLNAAVLDDANGHLGYLTRYFQPDLDEQDLVARQLETLDLGAHDIDCLVTSHLHFDHAGGHSQFPNTPTIIQRREWEAGVDDDLIAANGYLAADYSLGQDVIQVDGEHDVFGDGAIVCVPTFGHTPGHQSLRVRLESGVVILAADACYFRHSLEALRLPKAGHDRDAMLETLLRLRELQARGVRIFYGHDPDFWKELTRVTAPIT